MNYDEYMRAIIGEKTLAQPTNFANYQTNNRPFGIEENNLNGYINKSNTYRESSDFDLVEPTVNTIDLYPDIFIQVNPMVINRCKSITQKPTKDLVLQITNEIYDKVMQTLNDNIDNNRQEKEEDSRIREPIRPQRPPFDRPRPNPNRPNVVRPNNDFLRDLIRLLVINQLFRNRNAERTNNRYLQF